MGRFTNMPRADVVQFLEANGFAAYDSEPTDALREAAFLHEEEERERDIEEFAFPWQRLQAK